MGSIPATDEATLPAYSVPEETRRVFENGILKNPLIQPYLPKDAAQLAKAIRFEGSGFPTIPINWRFAESVAALKAYEALVVNALVKEKYAKSVGEVVIDT